MHKNEKKYTLLNKTTGYPKPYEIGLDEVIKYLKGELKDWGENEKNEYKSEMDHIADLYRKMGIAEKNNDPSQREIEAEYRAKKLEQPCFIAGAIFDANKSKSKQGYYSISKEFIKTYNYCIVIDIDEKAQKPNSNYDVERSFKELSNDKLVHLMFRSPSRKGLKILINIKDRLEINECIKNNRVKDIDVLWELHALIYAELECYFLDKYDLITDLSCKNINRKCIFSLDPNYYINPDYEEYVFDAPIPRKAVKKKNKKNENRVIENDFSKAEKISHLENILKYCIDNKVSLTKSYTNWINFGWFLISFVSDENTGLKYFLDFSAIDISFDQYEASTKFHQLKNNFDTSFTYSLSKYLKIVEKSGYVLSEEERLIIQNKNIKYYAKEGYDYFNFKYDHTFVVNEYIKEKYHEIKAAFNNNINVIKAPAGAGKSKLMETYIMDEYRDKNVCFLSLKTGLLDQQYNQYVNEQINVWKNYDENYCNHINVLNQKGNIVFSTIHSFHKLKSINWDLIIVDEAHLLVDYSKLGATFCSNFSTLYELLETGKFIFLSATPEKFISSINNLNYNYIDIKINNYQKTKINLVYTSKTFDLLFEKLELNKSYNRTNIIYLNDKKKGEKLRDDLFTNNQIEAVLLNTQTKKDVDFKKIINEELIEIGKTYIVTSIVSEGLNILNKNACDIYIIDNYTTYIENVYQLVNRFRNREVVKNVYYITTPPSHGSGKWKIIEGKKTWVKDDKKYDDIYDGFKLELEFKACENTLKYIDYEKLKKRRISNAEDFVGININRFFLANKMYDQFMKYIKCNKLYFESYIEYFFDIQDKTYEKRDSKRNELYHQNKVDLRHEYSKNRKLYHYMFETGFNKISEQLFFEFLNSENQFSDIEVHQQMDVFNAFFKKNYDEFKKIYTREIEILEIKKMYQKKNIKYVTDVLVEDYIFEHGVRYDSMKNKLGSYLVNKLDDKDLESLDLVHKKEYKKIVEFIESNKIKGKKCDYIFNSEIRDFMVRTNLIVVGKNYIGDIANMIGWTQDFIKIKGKSHRCLKI